MDEFLHTSFRELRIHKILLNIELCAQKFKRAAGGFSFFGSRMSPKRAQTPLMVMKADGAAANGSVAWMSST